MAFLPGKAIIFNTEENRDGSTKDVVKLESTFKAMNVEVIKYTIENNDTILAKIKEFISSQKFDEFEYVIIVFLSHGLDDEQIKVGRFNISLQKILLNPLFEVESLHNKLKWVIVQACGGKYDCHGGIADGAPLTIGRRYFLKSFACQEGCKAMRHTETGTIFIQTLCDNLSKFSASEDVLHILDKTRNEIERNRKIIQQTRDVGNIAGVKFYFTKGFEKKL